MGDLVSHGPGRVTARSLSGEGCKVNPCTTTTVSDRCQCWAVLVVGGEGGKEESRTWQQRPNAAVKHSGISRKWKKVSYLEVHAVKGNV